MKTSLFFSLAMLTTLILGSCATSNEVNNGGLFQKRKYNKGIYWNRSEKVSTAKMDEQDDSKNNDQQVSSAHENKKSTLKVTATQKTETIENNDLASNDNSIELNNVTSKKQIISSKSVSPISNPTKNEKEAIRSRKSDFINMKKSNKKNQNNNNNADSMFILAVIFAILIPPLGVLIYTNIDWLKVLICLLLTVLFFLPGMIYALLVVFDVI